MRPYANELMKKTFGSLCEDLSPIAYMDARMSSSENITAVDEAVRNGMDIMVGVICKTVAGGSPPSLICIKGLKENIYASSPSYR